MSIPVYRVSIKPELSRDGERLGIQQIAHTADPAILTKGFAFNKAKELQFADELKLRVVAPIMIPMQIYRLDEDGEYFVQFTKEEIERLYVDFQAQQIKQVFNLDHDQAQQSPSFILESWTVGKNPKADKSFSEYGIEVPEGTVMVISQFRDANYFKKEIIEADRTGYSIEGFLGLEIIEQIKNEIKTKFQMTKKKFSALYLEDGTPIWADKLEVGGEVNTIDESMEKVPLFDGEHKIKDDKGTVIVTVDGKITEVKGGESAPVEQEKAEEELPVEEVKNEVPAEQPATAPSSAAINPDEVLAIVQPKLDEILKMIAELKAANDNTEVSESIVDEGMSSKVAEQKHQKITALSAIDKYLGY